jgi:hypothetical protein
MPQTPTLRMVRPLDPGLHGNRGDGGWGERFPSVIPAHSAVIPAPSVVIPAPSVVIPAHSVVIPAKAGNQ